MTWRKYISKLEIKLKSNLIGMGCFMLKKKIKLYVYTKRKLLVYRYSFPEKARERLHFYYINLCCQTKNRYFKICTKFKKNYTKENSKGRGQGKQKISMEIEKEIEQSGI